MMNGAQNASLANTMDVEPGRRTTHVDSSISETLTTRGWAWEFLRRNPTFKRDLRSFRAEPTTDVVIRIDGALHSRYLEKWGLVFR